MDRSRFSARTVVLAVLCLAVVAFAAATLDSTTNPESDPGLGGGFGAGDGTEGTATPGDPGQSDEGRPSIFDIDARSAGGFCVCWLKRPLVQATLLLSVLALFLVGRWRYDALFGLTAVLVISYPALFVYLVLTSCRTGRGILPDLSRIGRAAGGEEGGLLGSSGQVTSPTLATQVLLVLVVALLGVVAVLVLTGDHDQLSAETDADDETEDPVARRQRTVAAVGAAAGRAADRLESDGEFTNEVYRAWVEMTEPLAVDHPESSTPTEFADAAVEAGIDPGDVERLTALFEEVRYGGAEPTPERERAAVETLRRIENAYADADVNVDVDADADVDVDAGVDTDASDADSRGEDGGDGP